MKFDRKEAEDELYHLIAYLEAEGALDAGNFPQLSKMYNRGCDAAWKRYLDGGDW